jgi:zinc D-Ala-D-Ala carboxypeptidase
MLLYLTAKVKPTVGVPVRNLWPYIRNFKRHDFACKSGTEPDSADLMKPRVVLALDALRDLLGRSVVINSAVRTPAHNRAVGGAPASAHLTGEAVDIKTNTGKGYAKFTRQQRIDLIVYARKLGFTGIGVSPVFIHLDMKPRTAAWIYQQGRTVAIPLGDETKYA